MKLLLQYFYILFQFIIIMNINKEHMYLLIYTYFLDSAKVHTFMDNIMCKTGVVYLRKGLECYVGEHSRNPYFSALVSENTKPISRRTSTAQLNLNE